MGARLFAAVVPPGDVIEALEVFVEPRRDSALRWTAPETWHVTLAFYGDVPDVRYEELTTQLTDIAARQSPFELHLEGAGAFPNPAKARVLWLGVQEPGGVLPTLARACRTAGSRVGIEMAREQFKPHVTLARANLPLDVTKWLRVIETFSSRTWRASELVLIESHLGQGPNHRPRYELRETFPLGG